MHSPDRKTFPFKRVLKNKPKSDKLQQNKNNNNNNKRPFFAKNK